MNQEEATEIFDGVFFEKLSLMLGNLQNWEKRKDQIFSDMYCGSIQNKLARLSKSEKEVRNEILQFLKILNLQYSFLCKLKRQEKEVQISPAFTKFQQFSQNFNVIKNSLLELSEFLGKFIGVTNYEYTQIRQVYDEASQIRNRYEHQKSKFLHNYNQKKQQIYSKKHMKKHFELSNYLDLLSEVDKERKFHQQAYVRVHSVLIKDMDIRVRMYKDIVDNLVYISKLYQSGFKKQILSEIISYFSQKYQKSLEERNNFKANQENLSFNEELFKQIKLQFLKYFDTFLTEITVANWIVSFQSKEQGPQRPQNKVKTNMILTFDNKMVFYKMENRQIQFEQIIEDVKIYPPANDGNFDIKNKKTKQKYTILFDRVEKEDEFFLHIQKIRLKK